MRPAISGSHSFLETNLVSHIASAFLLILVLSALVTAQTRLQLRAEVFNIFNHPNFSNPLLPSFAADMTSSIDPVTGRGTGFLPITVTPDVGIGNPFMGGGPRNFQLALKLIF